MPLNTLAKHYQSDQRGSLSLYFVIALSCIFMAVGCAIDYTSMVSAKSKLQDLTDATALAGAIAANDKNNMRRKVALDYYNSNMKFASNVTVTKSPRIRFDNTNKEVVASASAKVNYFIMGMFGKSFTNISATSTSNFGIDVVPPFSVAFAFDVSGSMGWPTTDGEIRIDALKQATSELFTALIDSSDRPDLMSASISTSFSSYNTDVVESKAMQAGYNHVLTTVADMVADGGTNSAPSMQLAYDSLTATAATQAKGWTGSVIFMTDGDNNEAASDQETLKICAAMKDNGFKVYTVAFEAPPNGRQLLRKCAGDNKNYFDAANARKIKRAFKNIGTDLGQTVIRIK